MCKKNEINLECGYIYSDKHGTRKIEYHVDSFAVTRAMGNELPYGGNLSVRFPVGKKSYTVLAMTSVFLTRIPSPRSAGLDAMEKDHLYQKMMGPGLWFPHYNLGNLVSAFDH